jgi:low temperature requirement protein LtrA
MLATAVLAVNIPSASHGAVDNFVIAYFVLHTLLVGLYLRSARDPLVRPLCVRFLAGYAASAILWMLSLLLPIPANYALWGLGLLIEMSAPILAWRALPGAIVADAAHTAERFGLFTIIVLGESVVVVVSATAAYDWQVRSALVAAGGFVIVACFWWLYFGAAHTAALRQVLHRGMLPAFIYGYSHLLVFVSLTAVSVGVQSAIDSAARDALLEGTRMALSGGIGGYLIGMSIMCLVTDRSIRRHTLLARLGTVAFVTLAALLGGQLSLLTFVGTLVAALAMLVVFEAAIADR